MRDLAEINLNDGGRPVTRPAPTSAEIAAVEDLIGRRLPSDYLAALAHSNGGHPELDTFPVTLGGVEQTWSLDTLFHLGPDVDSSDNVIGAYRRRPRDWPPEIVPIGDDGGGDLLALDLTDAGSGRVVLWVHDEPGAALAQVANSVESLIDSTTVNPDYI